MNLVHKIIAENVNRPEEFWNSAPIIFYDSIRTVFYAANREFMTRSIKNSQHGIRAQMVLKLTNKLKMVWNWKWLPHWRLEEWNKQFEIWCSHSFINQIFKQTFHHHLDNFIPTNLCINGKLIRCVLTELLTENWKHRSRWTVTLNMIHCFLTRYSKRWYTLEHLDIFKILEQCDQRLFPK